METFNKFKDWLLGGLLVFIAGMNLDIRNKLYELDKNTVIIEYRMKSIEARLDKTEQKNNETEKAVLQIEGFLLPEKIQLKPKPFKK
jgi:hypothetical protein